MQRSTLVFGLLMFALMATLTTTPQGAWAQEEDPAAAPAPAAVEAAPADDAAAPIKRKSYLVWTYESLGLSYSLVFLFLSFMFVALLVMNVSKASRASIAPPDLVEAFEAHLNAKQYSEAYELAKADDSFLGKVLAAGLSRLSSGGDYPRAVEAMQEVGEEENLKLGNLLSYIGLIGTIAPMVGLLGTVQGMIASFDVIATSPTTPKPSELAQGIATALFTTLVGLVIAIPAIAAYNILRNRVAELVLQAGIVSEGLMSRFENSRQ
jgi:biopolymer transport protein ExbB